MWTDFVRLFSWRFHLKFSSYFVFFSLQFLQLLCELIFCKSPCKCEYNIKQVERQLHFVCWVQKDHIVSIEKSHEQNKEKKNTFAIVNEKLTKKNLLQCMCKRRLQKVLLCVSEENNLKIWKFRILFFVVVFLFVLDIFISVIVVLTWSFWMKWAYFDERKSLPKTQNSHHTTLTKLNIANVSADDVFGEKKLSTAYQVWQQHHKNKKQNKEK